MKISCSIKSKHIQDRVNLLKLLKLSKNSIYFNEQYL